MALFFPPPSARTASASSPPLMTRPRASGTPRPERQIALLKGHDGSVVSAAFSPDGKRVVTASDGQHRARLGPRDRNPDRPAQRHEGCCSSAAFSPDGKRVVTASADKTARVWDAETGTPDRYCSKGMRALLFPPPSARTASASSPPLRTRPRASGTPRPGRRSRLLKGHDGLCCFRRLQPGRQARRHRL